MKLSHRIATLACDRQPGRGCGWPASTAGSSPSATPPSSGRWAPSGSTSRSSAWPPRHRPGLLAGGVRRRHLLLRRRQLLRFDGRHAPGRAGRRHGRHADRGRLLDGGRPTAGSSPSGTPGSSVRWAAPRLNAPVRGMLVRPGEPRPGHRTGPHLPARPARHARAPRAPRARRFRRARPRHPGGDPRRRRRHRLAAAATTDEATARCSTASPGDPSTVVWTAGDNVYSNGTADRVQQLLRADVGPPQGPHPAGARQPRVRHGQRLRVLQLLRPRRRHAGEGLVQLRPRGLARDRPQQQLRRGRRLPGRQRPGAVAPGRPRRQPGPLHRGHLAPPPVQLREQPRQQRRRRPAVGRPLRRAAPTSSSTATSTSTSASPPSGPTRPRRQPRDPPVHRRDGRRQRATPSPARPSPTARSATPAAKGVLKLTLRAGSYDWNFLPVAGRSFTDSGSGGCHCTDRSYPRLSRNETRSWLRRSGPFPRRRTVLRSFWTDGRPQSNARVADRVVLERARERSKRVDGRLCRASAGRAQNLHRPQPSARLPASRRPCPPAPPGPHYAR